MCWVMPPASPAATSVSRIASSSEVLPWSTWPMIVTTGGRSARLSSESSNSGASGSSSAAVTISILRSYSSAIALIDSSVRVWVRVAISPIVISFLITSALPRPSSSATSRTVAPDGTLVASGSAGSSVLSGGSSSSGRRRRPPRRRGGRCGGGPPIWSRRAACESITTRRFLPLAPPPLRRLFVRSAGPWGAAAFWLAAALRRPSAAAVWPVSAAVSARRPARRRSPWRRRAPSARRPPRRSKLRLWPRSRRLFSAASSSLLLSPALSRSHGPAS